MNAEVLPMRRPDVPEQPPHNIEAEQALLGAVLLNNAAFDRVNDTLEAEHFFEPIHQHIWATAAQIIRAGRLASPVTLKSFWPKDEKIEGLTWSEYLARLAAAATTVMLAPDYARTVRDHADRRELLRLSEDLAAHAKEFNETSTEEIIAHAEDRIYELRNIDSTSGGFMRFSDALKQTVEMSAKAYQRDGHLSGAPTGLVDLDQLMGGMQRSDLIILAGRPGMGKTALATNIAYSMAAEYRGKPRPDGTIETVAGGIVGFFSLEMSAEQLANRIISDQVEIPSSKIRRGDISEAEFEKIASAAQVLQSIPLYIEETGGLTISQLASRARRLRRSRGLDLLIVDYIQLMSGSARSNRDGRVQEVTEITSGLKALAKELGIPIIALSQLSRQVETRENKRPQLSDLRESGSIEQDADVVLFVFREEYYLRNREPREGTEEWFKWEAAIKAATNKAEIIIGKQRHGPTGNVTLTFQPEFTRFGNKAREDRLPERYRD